MVEVVADFFKGVGTKEVYGWFVAHVGWWCDVVEDDGDPQKFLAVGKSRSFKVVRVKGCSDVPRRQELDELPGCEVVGGVEWNFALLDKPLGECFAKLGEGVEILPIACAFAKNWWGLISD